MSSRTIVRHEGGWLQVKVPLPYALKWVNAYLLPDRKGWTLIDPGLRTPETERFWMATLREISVSFRQIKQIVVTHHHPDHYGLAGWFAMHTGAPVFMSGTALSMAETMWGTDHVTEDLLEAYRRHGLPCALDQAMRAHLLGFIERVHPQPPDVIRLEAGSTIELAGVRWRTIGGEGHAPGHIALYDPDSGRLICGDQVLPDISPNIGWMPVGDPDPLGSYLDSLRAMRRLDVSQAYPGHRHAFTNFSKRVDALLDHHESRLAHIREVVERGQVSSFDLCEQMFSERLRGNIHQLRFALSETIAHLVYLEHRGVLTRSADYLWTSARSSA